MKGGLDHAAKITVSFVFFYSVSYQLFLHAFVVLSFVISLKNKTESGNNALPPLVYIIFRALCLTVAQKQIKL